MRVNTAGEQPKIMHKRKGTANVLKIGLWNSWTSPPKNPPCPRGDTHLQDAIWFRLL